MKAGAVEFLTKPFAIRICSMRFSRPLTAIAPVRQEEAETADLRDHFESLTPREREVFALVVTGLLNNRIALQLGTSEITIKQHRHQVMQKMRADSLADLVRMAEKLGIPATK